MIKKSNFLALSQGDNGKDKRGRKKQREIGKGLGGSGATTRDTPQKELTNK